jgi:hypothetical protein
MRPPSSGWRWTLVSYRNTTWCYNTQDFDLDNQHKLKEEKYNTSLVEARNHGPIYRGHLQVFVEMLCMCSFCNNTEGLCHHGMSRPQVADGGIGLQMWAVAASILNKSSRTADMWWFLSLEIWREVTASSPLETSFALGLVIVNMVMNLRIW